MIQLIITLAIIGVLVWLLNAFVPMPPLMKKIINIVVAICVIFFLLNAFGVLNNDIPVPKLK